MRRIFIKLFLIVFVLSTLQYNCSNFKKKTYQKKVLSVKKEIKKSIKIQKLFSSKKEEKQFFKWHKLEKRLYGKKKYIKKYKKTKIKNTVLEQRSGRKRLYDHNLFLRALYQGNIIHLKYGELKKMFNGAVFMDFGSAILYGDGAPTVKDLYEDDKIRPFLQDIIATDINDTSSEDTRYIDIYNKRPDKFPFPVKEIPMFLAEQKQFHKLLSAELKKKSTPIIFRSTNSGPDLFYSSKQLKKHLKAVLIFSYGRNLLYFFDKYILFKYKDVNYFEILGKIDTRVGLSRRKSRWKKINWKKRKLKKAFKNNKKYIKVRQCYFW